MANANPPTAILAGHDDIAMGALAAIADTGRSRTDVSVIGYDNTDLAAHPLIDLTSVDQAGVDMGAQAATMLHGATRGKDRPAAVHATPTLRIRSSTARRPSGTEPRADGAEQAMHVGRPSG